MKNLEIPGAVAPIKSWVGNELSREENDMLRNVSGLPIIFKHIALMPDGHLGIGSMVGSVIATKEAVVPAMCGVDIGCGMAAVRTPFKSGVLDGKLPELFNAIEAEIPVGFNCHPQGNTYSAKWSGWDTFSLLHEGVQDRQGRAQQQLGTLGGGNHFIEVCLDTDDNVWLMLHSGSRNIGKELADRHIATAKSLHDLKQLPDPNLAYFLSNTAKMNAYFHDLSWAQNYALANREVMLGILLKVFTKVVNGGKGFGSDLIVNCHHNYVAVENHFGEDVFITRKGAINAEKGTLGIIPGSMGTKSFIVRGLGNADSYNSCSHGAGRIMSRTRAKKEFTIDDLEKQTSGVICRKDKGVLDEIPGSYKNIDEVMANQADLIEVVAEIKQVLCVKG